MRQRIVRIADAKHSVTLFNDFCHQAEFSDI